MLSSDMSRKQFAGLAEDGKADDHGYVETDPTGRYGRFKEVLGRGAMKTVYKAIDEILGMEVAWNQVQLREVLRSPEDLQRLYSEVHLLSTLNHDSIIQFCTSWIDVDRKTFNFITEMFTSGTLREYRKKYNRVDMQAIKSWARQILHGLVYLHGHDPPVIHRDLKCDNIFVNGHLGQVKIGDLGLAAILRESCSAHSVIGTPEFMAPELYEEDYNELVDVYSFGMCMIEMITSEYPYGECSNPAQIYKKVTSGKLPGAFYRIQDLEAQHFIGKCLVAASKRLSAKELLQEPFLASDDTTLLKLTKARKQKPFLNEKDMQKLKLKDDPPRTDMKITGKLNAEDDTVFLKVQIADNHGPVNNVYFPFDVLNDTAIDVAIEMVKELEIIDWEPFEIAEMIDAEVSPLVPHWKGREGYQNFFNYQEDEHHHPFHSSSSSTSSQVSFAGLNKSWLQVGAADDFLDDTSSQSSSNSGSYSNMNFFYHDEHKFDTTGPLRRDKQPVVTRTHSSTRFGQEETYHIGHAVGGNPSKPCKIIPESRGAPMHKNNVMVDNRRLTRNRSLVDIRSQLLHRSLLEEVSRRRLFNTVGAVEDIGSQAPVEIKKKPSKRTSQRNSKR